MYYCFTSLVKFIAKNFNSSWWYLEWNCFVFSFFTLLLESSSLVYMNATDLTMLILCFELLLNSFRVQQFFSGIFEVFPKIRSFYAKPWTIIFSLGFTCLMFLFCPIALVRTSIRMLNKVAKMSLFCS